MILIAHARLAALLAVHIKRRAAIELLIDDSARSYTQNVLSLLQHFRSFNKKSFMYGLNI